MSKKIKIESVDEFLARGKTITKLPPVTSEPVISVHKTASAGAPAILMSLEEADLFYGEARKGAKPKKPKTSAKIDIDALPEALKSKFITRMKEEHNGENFEEDTSEESKKS